MLGVMPYAGRAGPFHRAGQHRRGPARL